MTIPALVPSVSGMHALPPGRHRATLAEVAAYFIPFDPALGVDDSAKRDLVWRQALLHMERMRDLVGAPLTVWISGGFTMRKPVATKDVDMVYLAPHSEFAAVVTSQPEAFLDLVTLQDVFFAEPGGGWRDRLQPMSGHADAFVIPSGHTPSVEYWDYAWGLVKDLDGTIASGYVKGYVEVEIA